MLVTDRNNSQVVWEKKKPTMRQSNCVSFAVWKYRAEHMNPCWSETQVIWSTDTDSAWGLCYCLTFTQWYFPVNIGCKLLLLSQHANLFLVFCFFLSWEAAVLWGSCPLFCTWWAHVNWDINTLLMSWIVVAIISHETDASWKHYIAESNAF